MDGVALNMPATASTDSVLRYAMTVTQISGADAHWPKTVGHGGKAAKTPDAFVAFPRAS